MTILWGKSWNRDAQLIVRADLDSVAWLYASSKGSGFSAEVPNMPHLETCVCWKMSTFVKWRGHVTKYELSLQITLKSPNQTHLFILDI